MAVPTTLLRTRRASLVLRCVRFTAIGEDDDGPLVRLISEFLIRRPTWLSALDEDAEETAMWAVQWLVSHQIPEKNPHWMAGDCKYEYTPMDKAAKRGFLSVVRYLHRHSAAGCTPYAMEHAALNGHTEVVKFLHQHQCRGYPSVAIYYAATKGYLDLVQYLHETAKEPMTVHMLVDNGNIHVLEYVYARLPSTALAEYRRPLVDIMSSAIGSHTIDVVKWLHEHIAGARGCSASGLKRAIFRKKHDVVRFVLENQYPLDYVELMDYAAGVDDLGILKLFHHRSPAGCTSQALDNAAASGNLEIVRFLSEQRTEGCTPDAMDKAAANGYMDVVKYLHENRPEGCTTAAIDGASKNGHLGLIWFLIENRPEGYTTAAIDNAAAEGHLHVIEFLVETRSELCSAKAMDMAAAKGHLAVVRYLHERTPVGCTTDAMDMAAANGHVDVVHFLHKHRAEGCTHLALSNAVFCGYVDVVRFLIESTHYFTKQNRPDISFCQAFLRAILDGHIKMIEYLYEKYVAKLSPEERAPWMQEAIEMAVIMPQHMDVVIYLDSKRLDGETYSPSAIRVASEHHCLEIAEYLFKRGHDGSTVELMDLAAARGRLDLVCLLHETRSDGCTPRAMDMAARNGYLDVVRFLHANRSEGCTSRAMDWAACYGHVAIVEFLHENRLEGCTDEAMDKAARNGHLDVVRFLTENRSEGCVRKALRHTDQKIIQAVAGLRCPCRYCQNGGLDHPTAGPAPWDLGLFDY